MKTSTIKLIAAFAAVCLLSANVALAKNGGNGNGGGNKSGNGGNKNSGFKLSFGGGGGGGGGFQSLYSNNNNQNKSCNNNGGGYNNGGNNNGGNNNGGYNNGNCNNNGPINNNLNVGRAYEPFHSSYVVLPGDSFYEVALKEYGSSTPARFIAQFNKLPQNAALVLGQTLILPSISSNGRLSMSRAPAAESLQGSQFGSPIANFSTTSGIGSNNFKTTTSTTPIVEAPRPQVTVGSTLLVDGQTFGDKQGAARLRVSGLSLPIEVLEWTTSSVKIHLPTVELTSATKADIEVVRADGSLASKTAVDLAAATEVALTK